MTSIGDESPEAFMLRQALEDRGAVVEDWPVESSGQTTFPSRTDVLLVTAKVLDARVSALIRSVGAQPSPYLIVLSETGDLMDRINALELGADDFLTRDSDPREILARARSLMRRGAQRLEGLNDNVAHENDGAWVLNDISRLLQSPSGVVCELSKSDIKLIDALVETPSEVVKNDKDPVKANNMRVAISRLRRRFRRFSAEDLPIRNVWGRGYAFDAPLKRLNSRD